VNIKRQYAHQSPYLLCNINHLQNESGRGSEHSTCATSNLDGGASELRGLGRCRGGSDGDTASGRHGRSGVTPTGGVGTLHGEVGTANAGLVGQVQNKGELAEVASVAHLGGEEEVDVSVSDISIQACSIKNGVERTLATTTGQ
jgi:hypothetical protein